MSSLKNTLIKILCFTILCCFFSLNIFALENQNEGGAHEIKTSEHMGEGNVEKDATENSGINAKRQLRKPIEFKKDDLNIGEQIQKTMLILGVLCVLAFVTLVALRKGMIKTGAIVENSGKKLHLLDIKKISSKTTLFLIDADGEKILLVEGTNGVATHHFAQRKDI